MGVLAANPRNFRPIYGLENNDNPRKSGRALKGDLGLFWRYRVGDYRIICQIEDETIMILVLSVGHRKEVYR